MNIEHLLKRRSRLPYKVCSRVQVCNAVYKKTLAFSKQIYMQTKKLQKTIKQSCNVAPVLQGRGRGKSEGI